MQTAQDVRSKLLSEMKSELNAFPPTAEKVKFESHISFMHCQHVC